MPTSALNLDRADCLLVTNGSNALEAFPQISLRRSVAAGEPGLQQRWIEQSMTAL
jgi:hypothetical protein